MVYNGPWIQGADYTRSPAYLYQMVDVPTGTVERVYPGAVAPYDDEMNDILNSTAPTTTGQGISGPGCGLEVTSVGPVPNTTPLEIKFTTRITQGGAEWDASTLIDLNYYWTIIRPTMPSGAYGLEYESPAATPVAAILHMEIGSGAGDTTLPAGSPESMVGASLSMTISGGSSYAAANTYLTDLSVLPGMTPVAFNFDMSGLMGPQGKVGVSTSATKDSAWGYYDKTSYGLIRLGSTLPAVQMVYTLRPPRHRWLYLTPPTPPRIPPLRKFPRDDNLGTASATRIWPVSSQQGSLRRHGYF